MLKFYGYKRCSTSKKAQKWLDDHQVVYQYQDLVEKTPKQQDLLKWLTDFQDRGLRYFFNTSGQVYRQMHLKDQINKMTLEEAYTKKLGYSPHCPPWTRATVSVIIKASESISWILLIKGPYSRVSTTNSSCFLSSSL